MKLPSVGEVSDVLEVRSVNGFLLIAGVGVLVGAALAVTDAYVWPWIQRARMRVRAAAA